MPTFKEILSKFGMDSVEIIQSNMDKNQLNATGKTRASIKSKATDSRVVVDAAGHIWTLERGRGPRVSTTESNFRNSLQDWLRARGLQTSFGRTIEQSSRSLQYLINKQGTKLFRQGGRKDIITPIFDESRFEELTKAITLEAFDQTIKVIDASTDDT